IRAWIWLCSRVAIWSRIVAMSDAARSSFALARATGSLCDCARPDTGTNGRRSVSSRMAAQRRFGIVEVPSFRRNGCDRRGFALDVEVDGLGRIAAVADSPDDQRGAAHDVARRKDAVDARHLRAVIDLEGAPARDREIGSLELVRQVLGIEAQRLDDKVGIDVEVRTLDETRRLAARGIRHAQVDAAGADPVDGAVS